MVAPNRYPARFSLALLLSDAMRVYAAAWFPLLIGVLLLGAAPVMVANLPWWRATHYTASFAVIWTEITSAKTAVTLLAYAVMGTFVTAVALGVLDGRDWRALLRREPSPARIGRGVRLMGRLPG